MTTVLSENKISHKKSSLDEKAVKKALDFINNNNYPTRKTEDWRYVKLGKIIRRNYDLPALTSTKIDCAPFEINDLSYSKIVLVNGIYNPELSELKAEAGVVIMPIEAASENETFKANFNTLTATSTELFTALNTAYTSGGVFVHVDKKTNPNHAIYILNIATVGATNYNLRNLIVVDEQAQANVIQGFYHIGGNENLNNSVTEIIVKKNAHLKLTKIQNDAETSSHICYEEVYQDDDSSFKINTVIKTGNFVRNGLNIKVDGSNCYTEMNAIIIATGKQFIDNHTKVDHLKPHCNSSECYKYILKDESTGVFNGKVIVHIDAQKIQAYQQNNNVLLSDNATMNAKPELEIFADDVKCSHGSTTGQFDEKAIFYLQSRGISKEVAKELLIEAIADEVIEKIENEAIIAFVKSL